MAKPSRTLKRKYYMAKYNARSRGIAFQLTFEQWLSIWQASGQIDNMGKHSGQYVMSRFGDKGAYAVGNVRIVTCNQNHAEVVITDVMREARGRPHRGKPKTEDWKRDMRAKHISWWQKIKDDPAAYADIRGKMVAGRSGGSHGQAK